MAVIPERLRRFIRRRPLATFAPTEQWQRLEHRLKSASRVIDIGCGAHPHPCATVGVDAFVTSDHRLLGTATNLTADHFRSRGVKFVQGDVSALPFRAKQFDFAYSHHVFEHAPDPKTACSEMMRIAAAGAIVTPSVFSEFAFGRPYHLWLVLQRGNTLIFIRKLVEEDRPFGFHPELSPEGRWHATSDTNPFELLLNDGEWYQGRQNMPQLSRLLRRFWYTHSSITEVVFLWDRQFDVVVIDEQGRLV